MYCGQTLCAYGPGPRYDFAIALYSSEVTIKEDIAPTVDPLTLSGGSGGWVNRATVLGFGGHDTLGIRKFEVLRGSDVVATVDRPCVDWSVLPCSEPSAGLTTTASGTRTLGDLGLTVGAQQLRVRAVDAAGNTATTAATNVNLDVTGYDLGSPQGVGTSSAEQRTLTWYPVGEGAPVASASAHLCTGTGDAPSDCRDLAVDPAGPLTFTLPGDGSTATAQITLTDAAGNSVTSAVQRFARDTAAPAAPTLTLAGSNGNDRSVSVGGEAGAKVAAKLCKVGGTCADLPGAAAPSTLTATLLTTGEYDLTATLTDPSGNTSAPATLHLTRTPPTTTPKSMNLAVKITSNLRKHRISLTGSVAAGSTSRIDLEIIGKTAKGRRVISRQRITVPASGKFGKRLKPPAKASSRRPVELVITPKPNAGWRVTRYTHTIRP